jgi:hypothetical protein
MVTLNTSQLKPADKIRTIHVLKRGTSTSRLKRPAGSSGIFETASGEIRHRRSAAKASADRLARWTSDDKTHGTVECQPGLAYHFGRGIIDTPSDFGSMGSPPTHPRCWIGSLWSCKRAAALKCSTVASSPAALIGKALPTTAKMPRSTPTANTSGECTTPPGSGQVLDALVQIAGSADLAMGQIDARQFIRRQDSRHAQCRLPNFNPDDPANYRRSVYRFVFRTLPDPFMESLDCADASQLTPPAPSASPPSSLTMLNDKFVIAKTNALPSG